MSASSGGGGGTTGLLGRVLRGFFAMKSDPPVARRQEVDEAALGFAILAGVLVEVGEEALEIGLIRGEVVHRHGDEPVGIAVEGDAKHPRDVAHLVGVRP